MTNGATDDSGQLPLNFEYQFNYRELADMMKSYDTLEGMHRIDYLPFTDVRDGMKVGNYVLVETQVPEGYEAAKPKAITITETGAVQRFSRVSGFYERFSVREEDNYRIINYSDAIRLIIPSAFSKSWSSNAIKHCSIEDSTMYPICLMSSFNSVSS